MYLILKLLIINHLLNINTMSCTIYYNLMYLSDCNNIQYKEATKLVILNDKVKPYITNNLLTDIFKGSSEFSFTKTK